jgi:hypothetical protein
MPRPQSKRRSAPRQLVVKDIWGERWTVAESRPTNYRFSVYMGWPFIPHGPQKGGKAAIIVTAPLAAHLRANVQRPHYYPLPVGRKALRGVRHKLGLDHRVWIDARIDWWIERVDDLASMSVVKFANRHRANAWTRKGTLSSTLVWQMRAALLGPMSS